MQKKYDIIVVGAGPAGSMAAKFAAEQGLNVLVLEKDSAIHFVAVEKLWRHKIAPVTDPFSERESANTLRSSGSCHLDDCPWEEAVTEHVVKYGGSPLVE